MSWRKPVFLLPIYYSLHDLRQLHDNNSQSQIVIFAFDTMITSQTCVYLTIIRIETDLKTFPLANQNKLLQNVIILCDRNNITNVP